MCRGGRQVARGEPADVSRATRETAALALGTLGGLALIAVGLAGGPRVPVVLAPADSEPAAALVNGVPIPRTSIERFAEALASERPDRSGGGASQGGDLARTALDRAIDDELLLQRALALELPRSDFLARKQVVKTLIDAVVREAESSEPSAADIEATYRDEPEFFRRPGRLTVRPMLFREVASAHAEPAAKRVTSARERLAAGEEFTKVAAELGDPPVIPLPAGPLTPTELREYLGPTAATTAASLEPGRPSEPLRTSAGVVILIVDAREPGTIPPLDEVREQVRQVARRRAGEHALASYLAGLRARAVVQAGAVSDR